MAEMNEKQGDKLIKLIGELVSITKSTGDGGAMSKSSSGDDINKGESIKSKIINENIKSTQKYIDNLKLIEVINKRILTIESADAKLEKQREVYIKKMADLENQRGKSTVGYNTAQKKAHKNLIKDLERESVLEANRLNAVRGVSEAEKKLQKQKDDYYKRNKAKVDKEVKDQEDADKKKAKSDAKKAKKEEFLRRNGLSKEQRKEKFVSKMEDMSSGILGILMNTVRSLLQQDSIMSKLSANYALTSDESGVLKENILRASVQTAILGVKTEDLVKMQSTYTDDLERAVMLGQEGMISLANMGVATGLGAEGAAKMAASMELFGISAEGSSDEVQKLILMSRNSGMSASAMSKKLQENLKIANSYTFKGGLDGVEKMTVYSSKFRVNMQSIAGFAEKVSNPEGAIQTAASLQVLGGAFAQMADPMKMLNQGVTDMEGLTNTYVKMLDGLAQVDKKTGEVTVNGYDRLKIKAAAEATGISFDEMMTTVRTKAKRNAIEANLDINPQLKGDDKSKDLIASLSEFNKKTGKFEISVAGQTKSIASLSKEDISKLQPKDEALNINTIAQNTLGLTDIIQNSFNILLQTMMPQVISGIQTMSQWLLKGVNWVLGFFNGGRNADGTMNTSPEAKAAGKKRTDMTGGALAGGLAGAYLGAKVGTMINPGVGTLIGAGIGGLGGAALGAWGASTANDAIYDGKTGTMTKLNSKDQIVAMKPGGALDRAGSPAANALFGKASQGSNAMEPSVNPSNFYGGVSRGRSGVYNSPSNNNQVGGSITLNIQGSINLVGGGTSGGVSSTTKLSASELVNDRNFVRELTRIVSQQLNRDRNGGKYSGSLGNNSF